MGAYSRTQQGIRGDLDRVVDLFPVLGERSRQLGGTLSGGEQQMLAIGRALMSRPALLLLDEPSMGLAPKLVRHIFAILASIVDGGTAIFLVEQNARLALKLATRGYVLQGGSIVLEDTSQGLRDNPAVRAAYLGVSVDVTQRTEGSSGDKASAENQRGLAP